MLWFTVQLRTCACSGPRASGQRAGASQTCAVPGQTPAVQGHVLRGRLTRRRTDPHLGEKRPSSLPRACAGWSLGQSCPGATAGLSLAEDVGTHKMMRRDTPPRFNLFSSRGVRAGPRRPRSPTPFLFSPSSLFDSYSPGAVGKPTAGANPRQRRFGAAMPTPFPWQWAPNGQPAGKARMPKKSDAVPPKNCWPEAGSLRLLPTPGAAYAAWGTGSKPPQGAGGCNKAGKTL